MGFTWPAEPIGGILDGVIAALIVGLVVGVRQYFVGMVAQRGYGISGWYLTRFTYIQRDLTTGTLSEHDEATFRGLLQLTQRGNRLTGRILSPQSRATFFVRGQVSGTHQFGEYRENRRGAAHQMFFNQQTNRGDDPALSFSGIWGGYSAVEGGVTCGFDKWRELLRVHVTGEPPESASPAASRFHVEIGRHRGEASPLSIVGGAQWPKTTYFAVHDGRAVGFASTGRLTKELAILVDSTTKASSDSDHTVIKKSHVLGYVYVEPSARGRGVANQLVRHCIDTLQAEGSSQCFALALEDELTEISGVLALNQFRAVPALQHASKIRLFVTTYPLLSPNWIGMSRWGWQLFKLSESLGRRW